MWTEICDETELMWLSTCASSIETRPEKNKNVATTHPTQTRERTRRSFQCFHTDCLSGGLATAVRAGCSIVVAIGLVAISVLRMPIAPGQVSPRLIKTVQSLDTIIISTGEVALRRDDFNIRGRSPR